MAPEDWPYLAVFKSILGLVSTKEHSYQELANEINIETGGIAAALPNYAVLPSSGDFRAALEFSAKAFYGKIGRAMELIYEILAESDLMEEKRIRELAARSRSRAEQNLIQSGHATAMLRSGTYHSASAVFGDSIG